MDTVLLVVAVLFVIIIAGAIMAGAVWVYFDTRKRQRLTSDVMQDLAKQCAKLSSDLAELAKTPGYVEGLTKVCGDFVIQVSEMKELVERFRMSLFGPEKGKDVEARGAFQAYDDKLADESFEIQQMVDAGFSVGEAREKVKGFKAAGRFLLG